MSETAVVALLIVSNTVFAFLALHFAVGWTWSRVRYLRLQASDDQLAQACEDKSRVYVGVKAKRVGLLGRETKLN